MVATSAVTEWSLKGSLITDISMSMNTSSIWSAITATCTGMTPDVTVVADLAARSRATANSNTSKDMDTSASASEDVKEVFSLDESAGEIMSVAVGVSTGVSVGPGASVDVSVSVGINEGVNVSVYDILHAWKKA